MYVFPVDVYSFQNINVSTYSPTGREDVCAAIPAETMYAESLFGKLDPYARAKRVPRPDPQGWASNHEALLRAAAGAKNIIEIGVWKGMSAIAMAKVSGGQVLAIDTFRGSQEHWRRKGCIPRDEDGLPDLFHVAASNVVQAGLEKNITLFPADGRSGVEFAFISGWQFDLAHIDAGHSYASVLLDLESVQAVMRPGARICLDDFTCPEIKRAAADFCLKYKCSPPVSRGQKGLITINQSVPLSGLWGHPSPPSLKKSTGETFLLRAAAKRWHPIVLSGIPLGKRPPDHTSEKVGTVMEPWIRREAIYFLYSFIVSTPRTIRVFEYGGGSSTLWFLSLGCSVVSVDNSQEWCDKVTKAFKTAESPSSSRLEMRCIPQTTKGRRRGSSGGYFDDYVDSIGDVSYDIVAVDGRARVDCIKRAIANVVPGGCLVLDNSERPCYREGIQLLTAPDWECAVRTDTRPFQTTVWSLKST